MSDVPYKLPKFIQEFARLAPLVPEGMWPATLPAGEKWDRDTVPLALGIGRRIEALVPEGERKALHRALSAYTSCDRYLTGLASDEAKRWADDGSAPVEDVSEEHRSGAAAVLRVRAVKRSGRAKTPAKASEPAPKKPGQLTLKTAQAA